MSIAIENKLPVVLGVDASLRYTGLFWLGDGLIGWRQLDDSRRRGEERLISVKAAVMQAVQEYKPVLVALEGYSFNSVGRVFDIGELGGALKVALKESNIPFIVVAPTQVKKYVTANHLAEKIEVVEAINKHFGLNWSVKQNNTADAAALALVAHGYLQPEALTERHKVEVVSALRGKIIPRAKKPRIKRKHKFPNI